MEVFVMRRPRDSIVLILVALFAVSCGGDTTPTTSERATATATTVGATVQQFQSDALGFESVETVLVAVEFDDGTSATATATAALMDGVGLGLDALNEVTELYTWTDSNGQIYLIFQDSDPDRVVLEETGAPGEWTVVSVEE